MVWGFILLYTQISLVGSNTKAFVGIIRMEGMATNNKRKESPSIESNQSPAPPEKILRTNDSISSPQTNVIENVLVFQCHKCLSIVGDSTAYVMADKDMKTITLRGDFRFSLFFSNWPVIQKLFLVFRSHFRRKKWRPQEKVQRLGGNLTSNFSFALGMMFTFIFLSVRITHLSVQLATPFWDEFIKLLQDI